ncbi:hypothetical protein BpHYR1_046429 [Brachionus plicatilis]|uniref:Uncharacterized protein n=1 Tax=Brachionus plicatilis TaxID=10195 RepID=A0A3M7T7K8_BRAPC|nr:hypothetical protein BpHYR1_046429 [Brachionus plicatilis]
MKRKQQLLFDLNLKYNVKKFDRLVLCLIEVVLVLEKKHFFYFPDYLYAYFRLEDNFSQKSFITKSQNQINYHLYKI